MIIWIINTLVLILLEPYLINCKVYNLNYEVSLQGKTSVVSDRLIIVKLYEEFIVFVPFNDLLNHRKMVRTAYVIFVSVIHHILNEI